MARATSTSDAGTAEHARYENIPSSDVGELGRTDAQLADLNALSFSETSRTPVDGDTSRSQGRPFRTTTRTKRS